MRQDKARRTASHGGFLQRATSPSCYLHAVYQNHRQLPPSNSHTDQYQSLDKCTFCTSRKQASGSCAHQLSSSGPHVFSKCLRFCRCPSMVVTNFRFGQLFELSSTHSPFPSAHRLDSPRQECQKQFSNPNEGIFVRSARHTRWRATKQKDVRPAGSERLSYISRALC